jgi:hypothetical protein
MARAGVTHFEPHIDEAARSFANQLLRARDALTCDELKWSRASRLLEDMGKVRGTQFDKFSESFNRDFPGKVFGDVILDLPELTDGKSAAIRRRFCGVGVFFNDVRSHELSKRRHTRRFAWHACRQKLCASQADGPQDFIASKKIDNLDAVCTCGVAHFKRGQEWLDRDVEGQIIEILTGWRFEAYFIRRARTRTNRSPAWICRVIHFPPTSRSWNSAMPRRLQEMWGSGVAGTRNRSTTRGSRQRRAYSPGHWSATLSATTSPVRYRGKAAAVLRSGVFGFTSFPIFASPSHPS